MKPSQRYLVSVLALGWVALVACSVILFWVKYRTWSGFTGRISLEEFVSPSGLVPQEIEGDPNVITHSWASAGFCHSGPDTLWISNQQRIGRSDEDGDWPIVCVAWDTTGTRLRLVYWDDRSEQFVLRVIVQTQGTHRVLQEHLYAGPEGISDRPGKELGRFARPIVLRPYAWTRVRDEIVYDGGSRQFHRIDFANRKVFKGPAIPQGIESLQISPEGKNIDLVYPQWGPPMRKIREGETSPNGGDLVPIEPNMGIFRNRQVMVLDKDGCIYRLDAETLTLTPPMGYLPAVGPRSSNKPYDLLAYRIQPVQIHDQYAGCVVAAVGAEGMTLEMSVYDKEGRIVPGRNRYRKTPFNDNHGASGALASQYLLECLHPLSLSLLSRAIGPQVEAVAGHRGLFVLPYSFIATSARESDSYPIDRLFWTVVMLLPAILLAGFLAWRVAHDGAVVGLSRTARRWWIVGTIAFGLPAYITYRMTRPEVTLVTCANCGNPRRPDMERCHRCGAPWVMPELAPPAWRVMD